MPERRALPRHDTPPFLPTLRRSPFCSGQTNNENKRKSKEKRGIVQECLEGENDKEKADLSRERSIR
jgi:hypothetical protein